VAAADAAAEIITALCPAATAGGGGRNVRDGADRQTESLVHFLNSQTTRS
jgi:hypothetical protein